VEVPHDIVQAVQARIATLKLSPFHCCPKECLRHLLTDREVAVQVCLEDWRMLDKPQQAVALRLMIRLCSRWSERTARGTRRTHPRVTFSEPLLGTVCRRAFAR
jgi:hypothetical protein